MREGRELLRTMTTHRCEDPGCNAMVSMRLHVRWETAAFPGLSDTDIVDEIALLLDFSIKQAPAAILRTLEDLEALASASTAGGAAWHLDAAIQLPSRDACSPTRETFIRGVIDRLKALAGDHGLLIGLADHPEQWSGLAGLTGFVQFNDDGTVFPQRDSSLLFDILAARLGANQLAEADQGDVGMAIGSASAPSRVVLVPKDADGHLDGGALEGFRDVQALAVTALWQPRRTAECMAILRRFRVAVNPEVVLVPLMPLDRRGLLSGSPDGVAALVRWDDLELR